ncbi:acyl-CoA carboxylase subunit epsilon [Solwaraspora sp. WMMD791]|uniref:acyl-CoA carboxylase subunit epsilon n=1 Tax=Solwaraspora sp. WMMD791 TaxID=3016086 RepID=UPI00249AB0C4|nr:acyl-CoA carboxylase subunit epsilon [Solwaraspora sp. WMMD791]WFE26747.1 acyl-CoA carboxylase subunit epsilon [Solwaraspora sp. WMMD791]
MSEARHDWRITRGSPTAEELAALVGAVLSRTRPVSDSDAHDGARDPAVSRWARSVRPDRGPLPRPGPDAWRTSASPR